MLNLIKANWHTLGIHNWASIATSKDVILFWNTEEINIHVAQLIHVSRCSAGTSVCEREYQLVNAKIRHKYTVHYFKILIFFFFFNHLKRLGIIYSGLTKEEKVHLNLLVIVMFILDEVLNIFNH